MHRYAVVLVALPLLLVAPMVGAQQLPTEGTCGPLALNVSPSEVAIDAGTRDTLTGRVENRGNIPGNAYLGVDDDAIPFGWTVIVRPDNVSVDPGASASFDLVVRPASDATDPVDITTFAFLACGNVQSFQSQRAQSVATVIPTEPDGTLSNLGDLAATWGPFVLGAAVVGGFAAAAVVGRKRLRTGGFTVATTEPLKRVTPGRGTSFPLDVENRGRGPDTAQFIVGEAPEGWTAFTALPEFVLAPGEKRTLWLMVRAPEDAPAGAVARIDVTIRSDAHPERAVVKSLTAEVVHDPERADPDAGVPP